ncbi:hypothetical protein HY970_02435 [Candidatus Kaiserbacteria bacterium]|nr:hypothetical protein [Candidatus Kaiserbacteria bacterium]
MTREDVASTVHWPRIIWVISIVNPLMTIPQLRQVWATGETAGLSFGFLEILFFVQAGFSVHGFFTRDRFIMGSNGIAATMTLLTVFSAAYFRYLV